MKTSDGKTLVHTIKGSPAFQSTCLVMLTSAASISEAKKMLEDYPVSFLVKPVYPVKLLESLNSAWSFSSKQAPALGSLLLQPPQQADNSSPIKVRPNSPHVLLAEDNLINQKVAAIMLEKLGCNVDVAANGQRAIEMFDTTPYDMVFMDVQMPEMDGYEATSVIRKKEGLSKHTPIVALTASALHQERQKCLEYGMDDYIAKPTKKEDLQKALSQWLNQSGYAPATLINTQHTSTDDGQSLEVFAAKKALKMCDGDVELLKEFVETFLKDASNKMPVFQDALKSGNIEELAICAHSLKGGALYIGADRVIQATIDIGLAAKEGSLDKANACCGDLENQIETFKHHIEDFGWDKVNH
jgi:CheY-like chemotaxis protein/HPt (histidine-containing phosphotransfer) domain-containing protein